MHVLVQWAALLQVLQQCQVEAQQALLARLHQWLPGEMLLWRREGARRIHLQICLVRCVAGSGPHLSWLVQ